MYSAWATGKSMSLILRAMIYYEMINNNLGIILSKEFTDNVISPIESEVGYIKAGISTCLEYLPARLFIHQNELSINNELK